MSSAADVAEIEQIIAQIRACRVCGCTDEDACPDGCSWVEADLCSSCVEESAS